MRLFYENYKNGYVNVINNVDRVKIEKHERVNYLYAHTNVGYIRVGKLADIGLAYMVDVNDKDCKEYFRYEK